MIFLTDRTFERHGFSIEPEIAEWRASDNELIINQSGFEDKLKISELTETTLVLEIETSVDDEEVTTKLSFKNC